MAAVPREEDGFFNEAAQRDERTKCGRQLRLSKVSCCCWLVWGCGRRTARWTTFRTFEVSALRSR